MSKQTWDGIIKTVRINGISMPVTMNVAIGNTSMKTSVNFGNMKRIPSVRKSVKDNVKRLCIN